jgi:ABC-type phosphate/phosphonate transport system substrate-binding protein
MKRHMKRLNVSLNASLIFIALCVSIPTQTLAQSKDRYTFAISEGGSSRILGKDVAARYKDLAVDLSKLLKKPVDIEFVLDYKQLASGLTAEKYDLAFIHPAQIAAAALGSKKYRLLASEKGHQDYQVHFFVTGSSPLKTLADLKAPQLRDKTLIAPMEDSVTSAIARVMIKEQLGELKQVTYTNQEDNLPFASENGAVELESMLFLLKNGLGALGASASLAVINEWKANGGRVIGSSPKIPVKHVIASSRYSDADKDKLGAYFLALDKSDAGQKTLQKLGFSGFVATPQTKQDELVKWFAR